MPVVESYPSIVGIAQVAQAAGQGRYNKWLAEYNARSNQMTTNAALSGFQAGSSLGMSVQNMWQQQQQFAQRQGFVESQAAQKLQKDTEYTAAMMPALKPYMERLYPHLNEQEIGTMIGKMGRSQVEAISNTVTNAGRATAWHDMFRSPAALRREAENTLRNRLMGVEHHNARVQKRLEPIYDRMRSADFDFNESAVVGEISRILREEGEASPTTNPQEQYDRSEITVSGADGQPAYKIWRDPQGKVHTFDIRSRGGTGTRGAADQTDMERLKDYNTLQNYVDDRHKSMLSTWEQTYTKGYEFAESDVATHVEPDGSLWRRRGAGDELAQNHLQRGGINYVPATIPPRPTRKHAEDWVSERYPGFSNLIGRGGPPGVGPAPQPGVSRVPTGAPQGVEVQEPGQVMPQVPRPQGLPIQPTPLPQPQAPEFRHEAAIQVEDEAKAIAIQKIRGGGKLPKSGEAPETTELGSATHKGITELIGSEGRQWTGQMDLFDRHIRNGGTPEDFGTTPSTRFARPLMVQDEARLLEKNIKDFESKARQTLEGFSGVGGFTDTDQIPTELIPGLLQKFFKTDPKRASELAEESGLFQADELRQFFKTSKAFDRQRVFVKKVAAAAVRATPEGQRPDIGNIPIVDQREFEQRALGLPVYSRLSQSYEVQPLKAGDVLLSPTGGLFVISEYAINRAKRSGRLRYGSQLDQPQPFGIPAFVTPRGSSSVPR